MLDGLLREKTHAFFDPLAARTVQGGMTANTLTLSGFVIGLAACFAAAVQFYPMALVLILLNRFFKGLASAAARATAITPRGCYLDLVCDFVIFGGFAFFFALGDFNHLMASAFLLFAYLAMLAAWAGQALFDRERTAPATPAGGLVGQAEVTIFMVLCCVLPAFFSAFAAVLGLACFTAAALRIAQSVRLFRNS